MNNDASSISRCICQLCSGRPAGDARHSHGQPWPCFLPTLEWTVGFFFDAPLLLLKFRSLFLMTSASSSPMTCPAFVFARSCTFNSKALRDAVLEGALQSAEDFMVRSDTRARSQKALLLFDRRAQHSPTLPLPFLAESGARRPELDAADDQRQSTSCHCAAVAPSLPCAPPKATGADSKGDLDFSCARQEGARIGKWMQR